MLMPPLPRRRFLKAALALPLMATSVSQSSCSYISSEGERETVTNTKLGTFACFSESHAEILQAFSVACLGMSLNEIVQAEVIQRLDEELYFVDRFIREEFLLAVNVLEYLPVVYGEFSRFSKLELDEQQAFLNALKETRNETVRAVIHSIRMVVMLVFYGHQSTWSSIQYDGPFAKLPPQMSAQRLHYQALVGGKDV